MLVRPRRLRPRATSGCTIFTTTWLEKLEKLDFDRLTPGRQGRLPALQELSVAPASSARHSGRRSGRWPLPRALRARDPRSRPRASGAEIDGLGEGGGHRSTASPRRSAEARRTLERDSGSHDKVKRGRQSRAGVGRSLRDTLRGWYSFYDGYDPLFTWWMQEPYKGGRRRPCRSYADFLRQRWARSRPAWAKVSRRTPPGLGRRRWRTAAAAPAAAVERGAPRGGACAGGQETREPGGRRPAR